MKSIQKIIDDRGGMTALKEKALRIENPGYMPLNIEHVGTGPRGMDMVAVSHTFIQNGDVMRDPEIVFEVPPTETGQPWGPIEITQHPIGHYAEAVWRDAGTKQVMIRPRLVADLKAFARMWDKNLKEQGFIEAAKQAPAS